MSSQSIWALLVGLALAARMLLAPVHIEHHAHHPVHPAAAHADHHGHDHADHDHGHGPQDAPPPEHPEHDCATCANLFLSKHSATPHRPVPILASELVTRTPPLPREHPRTAPQITAHSPRGPPHHA